MTISSLCLLCQCQGDIGTLLLCLSKPLINTSILLWSSWLDSLLAFQSLSAEALHVSLGCAESCQLLIAALRCSCCCQPASASSACRHHQQVHTDRILRWSGSILFSKKAAWPHDAQCIFCLLQSTRENRKHALCHWHSKLHILQRQIPEAQCIVEGVVAALGVLCMGHVSCQQVCSA